MDIVFLITTYNRQESCQRLVDALQGQGDILVVNDGCDYVINGCRQHFLSQHNGKTYYWMTVYTLFALRGQYKYYFMLPDDFMPQPDLVETALRLWAEINDPQKICLNLFADRIGVSCWTNFIQKDMGDVWLSQWVDMCFLCEERFFGMVNMREVRSSFAGSKALSSGVGAMISRHLYRKGLNLYQVKESLVIPQPEHSISQMHNPSHDVSYDVNKRARNRRQKIVISDTRQLRRR
jgi:hypothetical protein